MNRWLMIGSLVGLLTMTTGCLHRNVRGGGGCNSCNACNSGGGLLGGGLFRGGQGSCQCGGSGCNPGTLGWQQGGLNYGNSMGGCGNGSCGSGARHQVATAPQPTGRVAYPYYTHRGPRDFLLDNPPTIGR